MLPTMRVFDPGADLWLEMYTGCTPAVTERRNGQKVRRPTTGGPAGGRRDGGLGGSGPGDLRPAGTRRRAGMMRNGQTSGGRADFGRSSCAFGRACRQANAQTSDGKTGRRREVCPFFDILIFGAAVKWSQAGPAHDRCAGRWGP
jgi:hypothetical protein